MDTLHDPSPDVLKHDLVTEFWASKNIFFLYAYGAIAYSPLIALQVVVLLLEMAPTLHTGIVSGTKGDTPFNQPLFVASYETVVFLVVASKGLLIASSITLLLQHWRHRKFLLCRFKRTICTLALCYLPLWGGVIWINDLARIPDAFLGMLEMLALLIYLLIIPCIHFLLSLVGATALLRK